VVPLSESKKSTFYVRQAEIHQAMSSVEGSLFRAEHLVEEYYTTDSKLPRETLLSLFDSILASEGFLSLLSSVLEAAEVTKVKGEDSYMVSEDDLKLVATYSIAHKNILQDLKTCGYALDLQ